MQWVNSCIAASPAEESLVISFRIRAPLLISIQSPAFDPRKWLLRTNEAD